MVDLERLVPLSTAGSPGGSTGGGPNGAATPLYCVHAGSGSAYSYLDLARLLGDERPVYGIEAPGFDGDREPVRSLPALSGEYAETLRTVRPDGEFLLLGWSLGGIIALDLARRLTEAGASVRRVVLVDVSVPRVAELPPEREIARRFLLDILAAVGVEAAALDPVLAGQPDDADVEAIFAAVESSGVLPAELEADVLVMRYAVFRAHVEASYGFEVTEPYHGPVVHVIARESQSEFMRWDKVATDLTEHVMPGDHHSIWTGDGLLRLAELVRAALADDDR
jgi:thioesterase domain-containing protein